MSVRSWIRWDYGVGLRHLTVAASILVLVVTMQLVTALAVPMRLGMLTVGFMLCWVGGYLCPVRERVALLFWLTTVATVLFFVGVFLYVLGQFGMPTQPVAHGFAMAVAAFLFVLAQLFMLAVGGALRPFTRWQKPKPLPEEQELSEEELAEGGYFEDDQ